jgi:hypothetical protein
MQPQGTTPEEQNPLLTRIHETYTLSNTDAAQAAEVEKLMLDNFLRTLAEISLAVAARAPLAQSKDTSQ